MNGLRMVDIILLSKVEEGIVWINPDEMSQLDPMIQQRLYEAKLIEDDGTITGKGMQYVEAARKRIEELAKGIPISVRSRNEAKEAENFDASVCGWMTGTYRKKLYLVNGEVFILGKPTREMRATEAGSKTREKVANLLNRFTAGRTKDFVKMEPFAYQIDPDNGMKLIWLAVVGNEWRIPIQAMYFDMVKNRFPTATFHVKMKEWMENGKIPVQARVTNRGLKNNVVALIQTVLPGNGVKCPISLRGEDGTELRDDGMSTVREQDDTVCRKQEREASTAGGVTGETGIEGGDSVLSQSSSGNAGQINDPSCGDRLERLVYNEFSEVHDRQVTAVNKGSGESAVVLPQKRSRGIEKNQAEGDHSGGEFRPAAIAEEERDQENSGNVVLE